MGMGRGDMEGWGGEGLKNLDVTVDSSLRCVIT